MPYVEVFVDADLSDYEDEELISELEKRGFSVAKGKSTEGIGRIEHLVECGFFKNAASEALQLIENQLGRPGCLSRVV